VDGCLCRGGLGGRGAGVRLEGTVSGGWRRAPEMEHLSLQELC
jgi:hypothetical protein